MLTQPAYLERKVSYRDPFDPYFEWCSARRSQTLREIPRAEIIVQRIEVVVA